MKRVVEFIRKDKRVFAKGLGYDKLFLIFVLGSIAGVYYEQILNFVKFWMKDGTIFWELRRGVILGPFNPLYGAGAVLIVWFLNRKPYKNWELLLIGGTLGGVVEYVVNFVQEKILGSVSWDYSHHFMNINGRTTVPFIIFWGLLGFLIVRLIYPWLSRMIERIPYVIGKVLVVSLTVFLAFDMVYSWGALFRQMLRNNGYPAISAIGEFYDTYYPDEILSKYFPNTKVKLGKKPPVFIRK